MHYAGTTIMLKIEKSTGMLRDQTQILAKFDEDWKNSKFFQNDKKATDLEICAYFQKRVDV